MPEESANDDTPSVQSASTDEQLSFWSLITSFVLKLIALGITIYVLPFNEWIVLESGKNHIFMRGIVGSDCAQSKNAQLDINHKSFNSNRIECIKWRKTEANHQKFAENYWLEKGVLPSGVDVPSFAYRALYYLALLQIAVYIIDLGITLIMCCRQKSQQSKRITEKRLATLLFMLQTLSFAYFVIVLLLNRYDFLHENPPNEACLGNAFHLLLVAIFFYDSASILIFTTEFYRNPSYSEEKFPDRLKRIFHELVTFRRGHDYICGEKT